MSALPREVPPIVRYPERLNAAWAAHLEPRASDAPTVVSLFAGAGGSSLGYSMAGYDERLAVEWDDHAAEVFRANFPGVPLYHGDITQLDADTILQLTRLQPGELSVLDGSPPCQGFSTAGTRHLSDSRNQLFREYVRVLQLLQPRAFVMENVQGMVQGKMRLIFADILRTLKSSGYRVSARLMTSKYFDVPQDRPRMIFVGVRSDLNLEPSHPAAQTRAVTLREAISDVENTPEDLADSRYPEGSGSEKYLQRMREGEKGSKYDTKGHRFGLVRLRWDAPARTILKSDGARNRTCSSCHPTELRKLTIAEIRRLSSFPDQFKLHGSFELQWARMGNSVPPLFMRAIARHIRQEILRQ